LIFDTDLSRQVIGGSATSMESISDSFFDSISLHCSFQHFQRHADSAFLEELDRVLSPYGACLIVPFYIDSEPFIYFDPAVTELDAIADFDADARLRSVYNYKQSFGRFYSPETFKSRFLQYLPDNLHTTFIHFKDSDTIGQQIYLHFALVLHRQYSTFKLV